MRIYRIFFFIFTFMFAHAAFAEDPPVLYRADTLTPEQVKSTGGFYPRGMNASNTHHPPPNINLWDHVSGQSGNDRRESGYISTTREQGLARAWITRQNDGSGYIYHITPTPNFIDVNGTLGQYSPFSWEEEFASMGAIYWQQVIGWTPIVHGIPGSYQHNPDYRASLYRNMHSSGAQPQLAGFPDRHPAWSSDPWRQFVDCNSGEYGTSCSLDVPRQQYGEETFYSAQRREISVAITVLSLIAMLSL